jgi:ribosomal protein S12 methylthiotransferase RimO
VPSTSTPSRRVALITLGCARNDVDSEELAGRLAADGWEVLTGEEAGADAPDAVMINTCGFVDAAKKDSIDTVLEAAESGAKVVAVGCLAERYGAELAKDLPEADAVLGFDHYPQIGARLDEVVAGQTITPHVPRDRRSLLPISPVDRAANDRAVPGHGAPVDLPAGVAPPSGPRVLRRRLDHAVMAPLKLASGCDRRCAFCAIPRFRGAFVSRRPTDVLDEARWLAGDGVREVFLVSENSTSYGKDLGDMRLLESLLPELAMVDGLDRVRVSYLQPAEMRPTLVAVLAATPGVAPYFDLSFQHASEPVLRRMRRFGGREAFLGLIDQIRSITPDAGIRTNVIVGFPGETDADVAELQRFLTGARLDAVGVFGYSDEDNTEAAGYDGKLPAEVIAARVEQVSELVDELCAQRAEERIGSVVDVLVERVDDGAIDGGVDDDVIEGRAAHQGPEVDGVTVLAGGAGLRPGDMVRARVVAADGVDLVADPMEVVAADALRASG